uniref:Acyl-CoA dehydrogenase n=1 Tax=Haemonchus placei TaxID=6290 RepID=A0A0N4WUZ0_HAEPC
LHENPLSSCKTANVTATLGLDADLVEVQKVARDFAQKEMYPNMAKWDRELAFFDPKFFQNKRGYQIRIKLGFGAIYCSDEFGGSGMSRLHASVIYEQLAAGCVSTAAYMSIHNMCAWMIDTYGSKELREKHIPTMATFENLSSYCLTEPDSGSDAASLRTTARREGDYYVVNGSKAFISGAGSSKIYVVMVRHEGQPGAKGIFCLLIEDGMEGFSQAKKESKLGWNTQPTRIITFEDVKDLTITASILPWLASMVRKQFGKPLSDFQWNQFKLAEMATKLYYVSPRRSLINFILCDIFSNTGLALRLLRRKEPSPFNCGLSGLTLSTCDPLRQKHFHVLLVRLCVVKEMMRMIYAQFYNIYCYYFFSECRT